MITAVLFDLDGTLLPMDQDRFIQSYLRKMANYMAPHGYHPIEFTNAIWGGTNAMIKNNGSATNEEVFWNHFSSILGQDCRKDETIFDSFYRSSFQDVRQDCGFTPEALPLIQEIRSMGLRTVLATNPLFPAIATYSRVRWAGLRSEDFEIITTYENSCHCKPNPAYYQDILGKLGVDASQCLMVGNDVGEDMIAEGLGMKVFLMTDCLINKLGKDISRYPNGSFPELINYIRGL